MDVTVFNESVFVDLVAELGVKEVDEVGTERLWKRSVCLRRL